MRGSHERRDAGRRQACPGLRLGTVRRHGGSVVTAPRERLSRGCRHPAGGLQGPRAGSRKGTAAKVRVLINRSDHETNWTTVGVSDDVLEASWNALCDSVRLELLRLSQPLPTAATCGERAQRSDRDLESAPAASSDFNSLSCRLSPESPIAAYGSPPSAWRCAPRCRVRSACNNAFLRALPASTTCPP